MTCLYCDRLVSAFPPGARAVWCGDRLAHSVPEVSEDPYIQQHYVESRRAGTSHLLAEMFALRQPPMSNTDREFLEGRCNGNQFEKQPAAGEFYRSMALAGGVNPVGKVYCSGLAEYAGDPRAWVSGRGDIQRICEERGWGCQGSVNLPVRNVAERGSGELAPDIIESKIKEVLAQTPEPERVDTEDLREQVKETLTPHWVKT